MGKVAEWYFKDLFKTSNPLGFAEVLDGVHNSVVAKGDMKVDGDFQAREVYQALK